MQPLTISQTDSSTFKIPFLKPFSFAGNTFSDRNGFYLTLKTQDGFSIQGEASPLEGLSQETIRRAKHDVKETLAYLKNFEIPCAKDELFNKLKHDPHILNLCASVRFAVESAILNLVAKKANQSLAEFLGANQLKDVHTAVLLQGSHQEVITDFKRFSGQGVKVFKLKVGDRNIALDVKKIQDIRILLEEESYLRLDANRIWNYQEACIFAQLAGNQKIDFIEEPVNDAVQLDAFYKQTHMRVALDESLGAPSLAEQEGVVAYVLKPMVLGLIPTLDWMEKAKFLKRKAIISATFESPVGFKVLANLACLSGQIAGLGTERWFKNVKPIVGEDGIIKKEFLL